MQTLRRLVRFALVAAVPLLVATVFPQAQGGGQAPAAAPAPMINASADPAVEELPLPLDRPGQHGRPHRRHRGLGERSEHHLHRLRRRRRVQVGEQRHDVRAGVRDLRHGLDRRHRDSSDAIPNIVYVGTGEPNNRQTTSFGDGIYKTTDGGKTFTQHRPEGDAVDRAHRHRSEERPRSSTSRRPATSSARIPTAASTRRPTAARPGTRSSSSTTTRASPTSRWIRRTATSSTPRATSGAAAAAASTVAARAARCGRRGRREDVDEARRATACRRAPTVASRSTCRARTRTSSTRRSRRARPARRCRHAVRARRRRPRRRLPARPRSRLRAASGRAGGGERRGGQPAAAPAPGGGRGGFDWCNNGGPTRASAAARGGAEQPANQTPPALDPARGGVFRSEDKGKTWTLISNCNSRPMYFSQLRVDPTNDKAIYVAGLPVAKSLDGGKTFATLDEAGGNGDAGPRRSARDLGRSAAIRST